MESRCQESSWDRLIPDGLYLRFSEIRNESQFNKFIDAFGPLRSDGDICQSWEAEVTKMLTAVRVAVAFKHAQEHEANEGGEFSPVLLSFFEHLRETLCQNLTPDVVRFVIVGDRYALSISLEPQPINFLGALWVQFVKTVCTK